MEFWYKYDRYFRTPRMCILVSFDYRDAFLNAENAVLLKLCARVLEDSLMESTYLAEVAALHSSMYSYQTRLELKVEGFSHKLPLLVNTIVQGILNLDPPMDRFNAMKESVTRALQNSIIKPSRHAAYLRLLALLLDSRTLEELLAQLENASISKFGRCWSLRVVCFSVPARGISLNIELMLSFTALRLWRFGTKRLLLTRYTF